MEKAGMLTVRKERNRSIKQKKLSTAQQHAWNSIQQGLAEVKKFEDGTITLSTADDFLADWEKEIQAQSE
ncbi:hypothetical protein [Spirosoma montaniterrae]|nr:hypothetical protein [Spirosoma montaniterrae]